MTEIAKAEDFDPALWAEIERYCAEWERAKAAPPFVQTGPVNETDAELAWKIAKRYGDGDADDKNAVNLKRHPLLRRLIERSFTTEPYQAKADADSFKDAERYRWLRASPKKNNLLLAYRIDGLDLVIDAAMTEELEAYMTEYKPGEIANND